MATADHDNRSRHDHRGKTSESLVDKTLVVNNLNIQPGEVILDAGCGNGYMAREFAKHTGPSGTVYAMDSDPEPIERLQSETNGTVIKPIVADITGKTRLAGASINLIYVSMVLHGFSADETDGFVNEVGRLLNPEGRLAVIEFNKKETAFGPPLAIRFSPEDLKQRIGLPPGAFVSLNSYIYMQIFYASASNKG